jgi:integrase
MAREFKKTAHTGLRYFDHDTRKHGKKLDRYYTIRFRLDGKLHTFGIGWLSDGIPEAIRKEEPNLGFEDYCLKLLREYKNNVKIGAGPKSPKEKRDIAEQEREQAEQERQQAEKEAITLQGFFDETYIEQAKADKKQSSVNREQGLFDIWIKPAIGSMAMKDVSPFHLEKIKRDMATKGQSPRSIEYCLSVIRQIFNTAKRLEIYSGDNPTAKVKFPKPDNGRMRFLTHKEADKLLTTLKGKSIDVHDMTLLSLNCGLRWGEITNLQWGDIDFDKGTLAIKDAKAGSRYAFLTEQATEMLKGREKGNPMEYVFTGRKGRLNILSYTFKRTVEELELNKGIDDPRQKVCFHTCRHSYASWLVEQGQDLYTVQRLLGHKTNTMTMRYSHISENKFKEAAGALSRAITDGQKKAEEEKEAEAQAEPAGQVVNFPR